MIGVEFDSMNPYSNMEVIVADDPISLLAAIKSHRTAITVVAIVAYGTKQVAYISGDIRTVKKPVKTKKPNGGL